MSKLDQINARPATLAFTSRVDARYLATLALFWEQSGSTPRSISELVRVSVESLADILVTSMKVDFVPTQEEAQNILGTLGILPKVQPRNLMKAMVAEGRINTESLGVGLTMPMVTKGRITANNPELQMAQAKLAEALDAQTKDRLKDQAERTSDMLKSLDMIPDGE